MKSENIINGLTLTEELEEQRVTYGRRLRKNKIILIFPNIVHNYKEKNKGQLSGTFSISLLEIFHSNFQPAIEFKTEELTLVIWLN